jgi:Double-GTPase 2
VNRRCSHPHCFAPDVSCHLGEIDLKDCQAWQEAVSERSTGAVAGAEATERTLLPWSGNTLGAVDVPFVAGRSNPTLLGVVGLHNAGKTTLLAAWYLLLGRGTRPDGEPRFAGSYTLLGWENVAHSLRWEGTGGLAFPLHTASGAGRVPGLLHLALRTTGGSLSDFLFADAPGEWFRRWAVDRDAPDAAGARWVSEHADVLVLVADSESLAGPQRGNARNLMQLLARRLGAERDGRPTALVWSKADVVVPREIRTAVTEAVRHAVPDVEEFSVSVYPPRKKGDSTGGRGRTCPSTGFLALLNWVLTVRRPGIAIPRKAEVPFDPLWAFGQ